MTTTACVHQIVSHLLSPSCQRDGLPICRLAPIDLNTGTPEVFQDVALKPTPRPGRREVPSRCHVATRHLKNLHRHELLRDAHPWRR